MPLGILYQRREELPTFDMHVKGEDDRPLYEVRHDHKKIQELFEKY